MKEDIEGPKYDDADGTDKWVQCDCCLKWYHQDCAILEWGETNIFASGQWFYC